MSRQMNSCARQLRHRASVVLAVCIVFLSLTCLGACSVSKDSNDNVTVFYLNTAKTGLVPRPHQMRADSDYAQVAELMELLATEPAEEGLAAPVSGFQCKEILFENNLVNLEFSTEYRELDPILEKLTRAAIVNTLCETENTRRVTIRVNGALIVAERGNKSENLTADQFIYNSGSEMINFERAEIRLYFASEDGKKLVETFRTVVFNGNIPMERLVVEQVIEGPNSGFSHPTVNADTKVVNVVTRDNICTVTLDKTFLTNQNPVDPEVAVYSIVNSLTELPSISQVQILIDGVDDPVFMESYALDSETLLQKNTKIVQSRE